MVRTAFFAIALLLRLLFRYPLLARADSFCQGQFGRDLRVDEHLDLVFHLEEFGRGLGGKGLAELLEIMSLQLDPPGLIIQRPFSEIIGFFVG